MIEEHPTPITFEDFEEAIKTEGHTFDCMDVFYAWKGERKRHARRLIGVIRNLQGLPELQEVPEEKDSSIEGRTHDDIGV